MICQIEGCFNEVEEDITFKIQGNYKYYCMDCIVDEFKNIFSAESLKKVDSLFKKVKEMDSGDYIIQRLENN